MRRVHPRLLRTLLLLAAALIVPEGCSREETGALPPKKDLYRYALAVAERARGLANPDAYLPLYHVGKVHQQFGMEDVALEYYRRALKLDPDAYEVYRDMGFILSQRQGEGRLREAVEAYQQSLLRNEAQKGIFTRIGLVLTHQGSLSRAVAALTHEIRRGTADAFTYYNLGQAYKQQNDNRKAVEHYRKALDMEPGLREAIYGLSQSLKVLGHEEEADQYLDRFQALRDEHQERELEPRTDKTDRDELVGHAAEAWVRAAEVFAIEAGRSEAQA
ncbi:MAG: tetratricopeptide repeat protein, partial [Planctomycetota bacterium]|nr:tetratricopeptide repeat protein [Planctomycetota bacterium]